MNLPKNSSKKPYPIYLGLGGNLGNPLDCFKIVINELSSSPEMRVEKVSSVWKTSPVGFSEQPDFLNAAILCSTTLSLGEIFSLTASLEKRLGKEKKEKNGPRVIDIDILYSPAVRMCTPDICVPHPRMLKRLFVLMPLQEVLEDEELVVPSNFLDQQEIELVREETISAPEATRKESTRKVEISAIIRELKKISDQIAILHRSSSERWWVIENDK